MRAHMSDLTDLTWITDEANLFIQLPVRRLICYFIQGNATGVVGWVIE